MKPIEEQSARSGAGSAERRTGIGWLVGILCGVLVGLWAFPPVRYTMGAQLQFALVQDSFPYLRALDTRRSLNEVPLLNAVSSSAPDDYLLQVGRATAMADMGVRDKPHHTAPSSPSDNVSYHDFTVWRLSEIARDFPAAPGAYAHLARYLMVERVRILRIELNTPPAAEGANQETASLTMDIQSSHLTPASASPATITRTVPPRRRDLQMMEWTLRSGQIRDRDNAFWPAMRAATLFAAERDEEALEALALAARRKYWDAYLYEEILGQWRLYSAAYGDNGAAQKIAPLSLLAFPHLREMRYMAEMARWHADRAVQDGRNADAIRIRRHLGWLGVLMRDTAKWSYEALYGTDLFFLASTEQKARFSPSAIRHMPQWERSAVGYLRLLEKEKRIQERDWVRHQADRSCELREQVNVARFDASYPGIPPGIPLLGLFGNWMAGYCLLQQALAFLVVVAIIFVAEKMVRRGRFESYLARTFGWTMLFGMLLGALTMLFGGAPSARAAEVALFGATILLVLFAHILQSGSFPLRPPLTRWTTGTTGRMLLFLLLPGLAVLYISRSYLATLHPVAALLASLMGAEHDATPLAALQTALFTFGLPLLCVVAIMLWTLYRRVPVLEGVEVGMRRIAFPAVFILLLTYFVVLNQTLRLDSAASQAINLAARDDLQWVLTHSGGRGTEE